MVTPFLKTNLLKIMGNFSKKEFPIDFEIINKHPTQQKNVLDEIKTKLGNQNAKIVAIKNYNDLIIIATDNSIFLYDNNLEYIKHKTQFSEKEIIIPIDPIKALGINQLGYVFIISKKNGESRFNLIQISDWLYDLNNDDFFILKSVEIFTANSDIPYLDIQFDKNETSFLNIVYVNVTEAPENIFFFLLYQAYFLRFDFSKKTFEDPIGPVQLSSYSNFRALNTKKIILISDYRDGQLVYNVVLSTKSGLTEPNRSHTYTNALNDPDAFSNWIKLSKKPEFINHDLIISYINYLNPCSTNTKQNLTQNWTKYYFNPDSDFIYKGTSDLVTCNQYAQYWDINFRHQNNKIILNQKGTRSTGYVPVPPRPLGQLKFIETRISRDSLYISSGTIDPDGGQIGGNTYISYNNNGLAALWHDKIIWAEHKDNIGTIYQNMDGITPAKITDFVLNGTKKVIDLFSSNTAMIFKTDNVLGAIKNMNGYYPNNEVPKTITIPNLDINATNSFMRHENNLDFLSILTTDIKKVSALDIYYSPDWATVSHTSSTINYDNTQNLITQNLNVFGYSTLISFDQLNAVSADTWMVRSLERKPLFVFNKPIFKNRYQGITLSFNITVNAIDKTNGNETIQSGLATRISKLFIRSNDKDLLFKKILFLKAGGSIIEHDASHFLVDEEPFIYLKISIWPVDEDLISMQLLTSANDTVFNYKFPPNFGVGKVGDFAFRFEIKE